MINYDTMNPWDAAAFRVCEGWLDDDILEGVSVSVWYLIAYQAGPSCIDFLLDISELGDALQS